MENKNDKYQRKPIHEFKANLSKDGRYWIFKNIETWIIPATYLDKIRSSQPEIKNKVVKLRKADPSKNGD